MPNSLLKRLMTSVGALSLVIATLSPAFAKDGPGEGPRASNGPGCTVFPAPASVGTTIGLSYFGPPASDTNPSFVGPTQLLKSGTVDDINGRITLPLYEGFMDDGSNTPVWYILTDTSDESQATALGLNFSAKLQFAAIGARTARFGADNVLHFQKGRVNFAPHRVLTPGSPNAYPPALAVPGSVGDKNYSPFVMVTNQNGTIYNAPIIAFGVQASEINFPNGNVDYTRVHDEVVAIDTIHKTVTLQLINGFSFGRPVWYLSMDSSDPTVAAIEGATYAPLLGKLPVGGDDSFSSPVERIFIAENGATDCNNPLRQGLDAAITDNFRPNNTLGGIPTLGLDYSPAWDINLYEWTPAAIRAGYRQQLREEFQILTYAQDGLITGPKGKPFGSIGVINNCPIVERLD
ncbi:hypothetical protein GCM10011611_62450 [Aliidongia dinghuensis]|uniref:Uncharacterized protein n=1 Tax=Aliidongia dinghuensis TaxID=1867774 RepID=A0A8J2Z164_9PROT|nr:hypothetical protein [Aliidongia dinghuensis]GGF47524.1 hypothetical protein GCM10011611_62450 [Aliidongia dinghuensis]